MSGAVLGIDPSLSGFAYALTTPALDEPMLDRLRSKPAMSVRGRMDRYDLLTRPVYQLVREFRPALTLIEGYAFAVAGTQRGQSDRAELGGILRWRLDRWTTIVEVPPSTLKKFGTGKGNAKKAEVVSAVSRRYDRNFKTDDEADAWVLMELGRCLLGQTEPETKAQREALDKLRPLYEVAA